jgi:hypothetical protein
VRNKMKTDFKAKKVLIFAYIALFVALTAHKISIFVGVFIVDSQSIIIPAIAILLSFITVRKGVNAKKMERLTFIVLQIVLSLLFAFWFLQPFIAIFPQTALAHVDTLQLIVAFVAIAFSGYLDREKSKKGNNAV